MDIGRRKERLTRYGIAVRIGVNATGTAFSVGQFFQFSNIQQTIA
jgi:hypothetical protein